MPAGGSKLFQLFSFSFVLLPGSGHLFSVDYKNSDSAVVVALCCKPPGHGFESASSYIRGMRFSRVSPLGHTLWLITSTKAKQLHSIYT